MSQAAITLIVLVVAIILFVIDILPMGLVAFCVPVVLYFLGIIEVGDIFTDVINSNVILIITLYARPVLKNAAPMTHMAMMRMTLELITSVKMSPTSMMPRK